MQPKFNKKLWIMFGEAVHFDAGTSSQGSKSNDCLLGSIMSQLYHPVIR